MKRLLSSVLIIFMFFSLGCGPNIDNADRVLIKGNIETMNPDAPKAEAIAINEGKIVFVGSNDDAHDYIGSDTDVIDLKGKYVTPGFIESHNHVIASNWTTSGVDLSSARSPKDVGRLLKLDSAVF